MMPAEPPTEEPIDVDIPCPACGYNLRGLPGDLIRCPECGARSLRRSVWQAMLRRHGQMHFADPPILAFLCAWVTLAFGAISLIVGPVWSWVHPLTALALAGLATGAARFRRQTRARPGWWIVLLAYLFAGCAFPISTFAGVMTGFSMIIMGIYGDSNRAMVLGIIFVASVGLAAAAWAATGFASKRIKRMLESEMFGCDGGRLSSRTIIEEASKREA